MPGCYQDDPSGLQHLHSLLGIIWWMTFLLCMKFKILGFDDAIKNLGAHMEKMAHKNHANTLDY